MISCFILPIISLFRCFFDTLLFDHLFSAPDEQLLKFVVLTNGVLGILVNKNLFILELLFNFSITFLCVHGSGHDYTNAGRSYYCSGAFPGERSVDGDIFLQPAWYSGIFLI